MPLPQTHTPSVGFAAGHTAPDGRPVVGVVDRFGAVRAEIDDLVVAGFEMHDERPLEREPRVIRADRDPHDTTLTLRPRDANVVLRCDRTARRHFAWRRRVRGRANATKSADLRCHTASLHYDRERSVPIAR